MTSLIQTKNLAFENFIFYKDIEIIAHSANFLTGASGAGKTTLLKLLNRTAKKSAGEIFFCGENINKVDPVTLRQQMMLLGQDPYLFDGSIKDNFSIFYSYLEKPTLSDEKMKEYLSFVSIDFELSKNCQELSGGEKQRIFIAIHLSLNPKVILLDEPTSALDQKTGVFMMKSIIAYAKSHDITLLIISHNTEIVAQFSQNTIAL